MLNFNNQVYLGTMNDPSGNPTTIIGADLLDSIEIHTPSVLGTFGARSITLVNDSTILSIDGSTLTQQPMYDNSVSLLDLNGSLLLPTNVNLTISNTTVISVGNRDVNVVHIFKDGYKVRTGTGENVFGVLVTSGANGDLPTSTNMGMTFVTLVNGQLTEYMLPAGNIYSIS